LIRNDSRLLTIAVLNFSLFLGFSLWGALFNNFAVEDMGADAWHIGIIQGLREIPGLLGILSAVLALYIAEIRLTGIMVVILGLGLVWTSHVHSILTFVLATMVMSTGFHYYQTAKQSVVLKVTSKAEAPKILGSLASMESVAGVFIVALIFLTTKGPIRAVELLSYRQLYLGIGILVIVVGVWGIFRHRGTRREKINSKMRFQRRYLLYYILTFLAGSRRQIFTTFAMFLLVARHGTSVQTAALLIFTNNMITSYTNHLAGRLIIRFGERSMLTMEYVSMIAIFAGYAFVQSAHMLYAFYVLDGIFFGLGIGISTYFQKVALPEDITANVGMGMTVNHISAVAIPLIGGLLWSLGHQATFLMGSGMAVLSLVTVQFIPRSIAKWSTDHVQVEMPIIEK
jgi:MFS family permease